MKKDFRTTCLFFLVLLTCGIVLIPNQSLAQETKKIKIDPTDEDGLNAIRKITYRYPDFLNGKVYFKNGTFTTSKLNYNLLNDEIEFITSSKDTLALDEVYKIKNISIGEDTYYFDHKENLLKFLGNYKTMDLLVSEKYELTNVKNKGAFGQEYNSLSPTSSSFYYDNAGNLSQIDPNSSLEYTVKLSYYFKDQNNRYRIANKRSIYKLFPEHKNTVKTYIKENNINLQNGEELKQLLEYCSALASQDEIE